MIIPIGKAETEIGMLTQMANRHGLIAGATGTGKTVTLQVLSEGLSMAGIPVFMADVKGDLAGISQPGEAKPKIVERAQTIGLGDLTFRGFSTQFWDAFGEKGLQVRGTISDMGPLLLSRLLDLNDVQEGVLNVAFKVADEQGLLLLDLKDLHELLTYLADNAKELTTEYGNITPQSIGAIQRALLILEQQGGERFFGEPALELADLMAVDPNGVGIINVLDAQRLMSSPRLYATFLLWLLSELFEDLPEVGDLEKPKLVFFFDEAHLLFDDAPKTLVDKIEQVVRLIRSKGIGVFFVTQNPIDLPDEVLGQLGNKFQHALRAFTPRDQKAVDTAAETFRQNPKIDVREAITQLGVGEALVSVLDEKGTPGMVERTLIRPPQSRIGPITEQERGALQFGSPLRKKYEAEIDRESAYEKLKSRAELAAAQAEQAKVQIETEKQAAAAEKAQQRERATSSRKDTLIEAMSKSAMRAAGSAIGRSVIRGVLGSIFKGR